MSDFYSVSGSISLNKDQLSLLQHLISVNEDKNPNIDAWIFHADGGWSSYAFFGHTVKVSSLEKVRAQLQRIADTIQTKDPDVDWVDFVDGFFLVVYAVGEHSYEWVLSEGVFQEHRRA